MLTKKTKLYKIGIFMLSDDENNSVNGLVCDLQRGRTPKKAIADFFLTDFLGCKLYDDPPIITQRFFEESQNYFEKEIDDPIERAICQNHLLSELTSQKPTVHPKEFAERNLDIEHRKSFLDYLEEKEISENQFDKNIALVKNRIDNMLIEFVNGIKVIAPHNVYENSVQFSKLDDGRDRIEITDTIKRIASK